MRHRIALSWIFVLAFVVGCAQLGLPTPETFNERLAAGYQAVTGARASALALLKSGQISAADAQNVQEQADNARAGLDIARATQAADPTAANAKLTAVVTALTALQTYLRTKGGA